MNLKRFFAKDMRTALAEIKEELGSDAIIMSSKKVSGGIEIVAAIDNGTDLSVKKQTDENELAEDSVSISSKGVKNGQPASKNVKNPSIEKKKQEQFADSLAALLARQEKPVAAKPKAPTNPKSIGQSLGFDSVYEEAKKNRELESDSYNVRSNSKQNTNSGVGKEEFNNLTQEVEAIRKLLQVQLAGLMEDTRSREEPIKSMLSKLLTSAGFDEKLAVKLCNKVGSDSSFAIAWQELARILENNLIIGTDSIMKNGGAIALIGPTGVGKTTTLAKLAARFALKYGSEQVALVSTDHYRIGASEQLQTYGRIMGCVVKQVDDVKDMAEVLYTLRNKSLVLIDTAGFGQRDSRLEQELLEIEKNARVKLQHYLVMSGTSQRRVLEDTYTRFSQVGIDGLILTKLDEALSLGDAASVCIAHELPLCYVTTGQRVPEDIDVANAKKFVNKLLAQIEESENAQNDQEGVVVQTGADWARDLAKQ